MRITLDKGAMEVLLNSMSDEARADFSNQVMKQVIQKLTSNLTAEQFRRNLDAGKRELLNEYLKHAEGYSKAPQLSQRVKDSIKKAFEMEVKELRQGFLQELRQSEIKLRSAVEERSLDLIERAMENYSKDLVEERVTKAIQNQLGSLFELGQAIRDMKTVTPEVPNESK